MNLKNNSQSELDAGVSPHALDTKQGLRRTKRASKPIAVKTQSNKKAEQQRIEQEQRGTGAPSENELAEKSPTELQSTAAKAKWSETYTSHADLLGGVAYGDLAKSVFNYETFVNMAGPEGLKFVQQMNPKDPLEKLAVMEALWTHARLARMSQLAVRQTTPEGLRVVNEACDRAANTFRRLMLAIDEHRRPASSDSWIAIQQANLAQQQVVQNVKNLKVAKKR